MSQYGALGTLRNYLYFATLQEILITAPLIKTVIRSFYSLTSGLLNDRLGIGRPHIPSQYLVHKGDFC